jgi:hypothetical protein
VSHKLQPLGLETRNKLGINLIPVSVSLVDDVVVSIKFLGDAVAARVGEKSGSVS